MSEQETEIGEVMTYYANIGVAAIELTGSVNVGDTIIFRGLPRIWNTKFTACRLNTILYRRQRLETRLV